MTQRLAISNIEGPYTRVVQVWEEYSPDGSFEPMISVVEEIILEPGQCTPVTIWGTRGLTIREAMVEAEQEAY